MQYCGAVEWGGRKEIKKLWNLSENLFSSKFHVGNFPFLRAMRERREGKGGGRESKVLVNSISRVF